MIKLKKIFEYQLWHLLALIALLLVIRLCLVNYPDILSGSLWSIGTSSWFWLAIAVPIVHQIYVWLIWRLELYHGTFTKRCGLKRAFTAYAIGFSILFVGRLIAIVILAVSNRETLAIASGIAYVLAALIAPLVVYLFYSVKLYFTIERAYGIDHFDKEYCKPFEKQGIFR